MRPVVRDLLDRSGVTAKIGAEQIYGRVLEGVLFHLSARGTHAETLLGLSGDALKRLQQVVSELLVQAEGDRRTQLEALATQLSRAIDETARGKLERVTGKCFNAKMQRWKVARAFSWLRSCLRSPTTKPQRA